MQWFEKIIKKRFSSSSLDDQVPDLNGIDSEELWVQISESIPQQNTPKGSVLKWRLLSGLLLVVFFTLGLLLFNNNTISKVDTTENANLLSPRESSSTVINSTLDNENKANVTNLILIEEKNVLESENLSFGAKSSNGDPDSKPKQRKANSKRQKVENLTEIEKSLNGTFTKLGNDVIVDEINNGAETKTLESKLHRAEDFLLNDDSDIVSNIPNQRDEIGNRKVEAEEILLVEFVSEQKQLDAFHNNSDNKIVQSKSDIYIQKLIHKTPDLLKVESELLASTPSVTISKVISRYRPWSIMFIANVNTYDQTYDDLSSQEEFADEANQSVDSLKYGSGFGFYLGYNLNSKWSISSGVEINHYENQLNKVISTDSVVFETTSQIFRNYKFIRTVKHTNKISAVTIPLSISYDYNIGRKIGIGSALGASYSFVTSENVKVLGKNNAIIDFDELQVRHFDNYFSFRINPYIRYQMSNIVALRLDFGFSRQSHGTSSLLDLTHRSTALSVGVGVKYNFE